MPTYTFTSLSSHEFELLTRDLLQEEMGITLESFKIGRDKGIDLRYTRDEGSTLVIQCKHYAASNVATLKRHLRSDEAPKVQQLKPDRYILVTSLGLNPQDKDDILSIFSPYCTSASDVYGRDDLNNLLGKFPQIEMQHYKLWLSSTNVLDKLLHSATVNRTRVELQGAHARLKYYVQNKSYFRAKGILDQHHYCIIVGVPGIGKTTLAEVLFIDYVNQGFEPVRVYSSIEEAFELLKPETPQVFYFDDFLGSTTFNETTMERNEDKQLLAFIQNANESAGEKKFILTTRDYILQQARLSLESLRSADLNPRRCTIELSNYTRFNRAEILYNHVYFSNLSNKHKHDLLKDQRYITIIDHGNYSPRVIHWMTQMERWRPGEAQDFAVAFLEALDNPYDLWQHAFERHLSSAARNLLLVLVSLPERVHFDDLKSAFLGFHKQMCRERRLEFRPTDFRDALDELEGTFITLNRWDSRTLVVQLHNPSVRDFLVSHLEADADSILGLMATASFFSQLQWLWGRPSIGGLQSGRPYPIQPRYRNVVLEDRETFVERLMQTFSSESPFIHMKSPNRRRPARLAGRIVSVMEIADTLETKRLSSFVRSVISTLKERAKRGEEVAFELAQLADRLKDETLFLDIKEAFFLSLRSYMEFERYLVFKRRYRSLLTREDQLFVEERFGSLYPGKTLSFVESLPDDDDSLEEDEWDDEWEGESREQRPVDPNELIVDLFGSLR